MLVILLTYLIDLCLSAGPSSSQIFCSSFCAPSGCNNYSPSDCNTKCNTGWGWSWTGSDCSVSLSDWQFVDSSDDSGGMIVVTPYKVTTNCPTLTNTYLGGVAPYGDFKASDTVNVTLYGGTTVPHYQIDLIFDIILVDTDSGGSTAWSGGSNKVKATLYDANTNSNTTTTITTSFQLGGGATTTNWQGYCGATNKQDSYYQFKLSFAHNNTNTDITFSLTTDNPNTNAIWVAKEFIYDLRACNAACLSCNGTGAANNTCFSCDSGLGYMLNNYSCYNVCRPGFGYTDDPAMCIYCDLHCSTCYGLFDNCSVCITTTGNKWKSYLYYNDSLGYWTCVNPCPAGNYLNTTLNTCELCDAVCATCKTNSSYCQSCVATYGWTGNYCYNPCP